MDKPISEINFVRIRNGETIKILPDEWAQIVLYMRFKNLQAKLKRRN